MKIFHVLTGAGLGAVLALIPGDATAQRGRGGARPVGGVPMSRPAAAPVARPNPVQSGAVHGPYGGGVPRPTGTATVTGGSRGGVHTGPGGTTVAGGAKAGTVTGPGGNTVGGAKAGAVVIGPNGNAHATGGRAVAATGPNGTAIAGSRGAVATAPRGAVVTGGRGAAAVGPNGVVAAERRGAVAAGPRGAIYHGTRYVGASGLHGQGVYIRNSFRHYDAFTPAWYRRYPGAWFIPGVAWSAWAVPAWATWAGIVGYGNTVAPFVYDYGDNITYQNGSVYFADQPTATEQAYADQASAIAAAGQADPGPGSVWQPLGVFAMVAGDETTSNDTFQLAMDQNGILRGNYFNAAANTVAPVKGALDKTSQRVAWTVGGQPYPVYEAGMYNLTQDDTTMLVHFDRDQTEQYRLFRIPQPPASEVGPAP